MSSEESKKDIDPVIQIWTKLNQLFGNKTNQVFAMEYPGRILDMGNFAYKGSDDVEAQQTKPQAVVESEFRLCDDIYDIGQITGGAKGSKLSQVYSDMLHSYLPSASSESLFDTQVLPDQVLISNWLMDKVQNFVMPPNDPLSDVPKDLKDFVPEPQVVQSKEEPETIPRIDLYQKLLSAYEDTRFRWKKFKLSARPGPESKPEDWDLYNRTMSVFAPAVDAKLEGLWGVLLVRGEYHRVRHYLGLIDVHSSSEELLQAKEALRASVMRSVDDTQDIYPVNFSPSSWASYLSTDFEPKDLLMDSDAIRTKLLVAEESREFWMQRKAELEASIQNIDSLVDKMKNARVAYTTAQEKLNSGLSDTAITLISVYLKNVTGEGRAPKPDENEAKKALDNIFSFNKLPSISAADIKRVFDGQSALNKQYNSYIQAAESVARTRSALSEGTATDPNMAIAEAEAHISTLSTTIRTLKGILETANSPDHLTEENPQTLQAQVTELEKVDEAQRDKNKIKELNDKIAKLESRAREAALNVEPPTPKKGASHWQTILIDYNSKNRSEEKHVLTTTTRTTVEVGTWFWRVSTTHETTESTFMQNINSANNSISIGMNVMKVTINRPWLQAQIFNKTGSFVRLADDPFSAGFHSDELAKPTVDESYKQALEAANKAQLPSYPVAFLIAKDVSIKITASKDDARAAAHFANNAPSAGGGILGFSISSASDDGTNNRNSYSASSGESVIIKIPGPQIIGWFLQVVPQDESVKEYKALNKEQFKINTQTNTAVPETGKPVPKA